MNAETTPAVEVSREDMLAKQVAVASALASLAVTRSHRAAKLLEACDLEALKDEVGAMEDLLQRITKELA